MVPDTGLFFSYNRKFKGWQFLEVFSCSMKPSQTQAPSTFYSAILSTSALALLSTPHADLLLSAAAPREWCSRFFSKWPASWLHNGCCCTFFRE